MTRNIFLVLVLCLSACIHAFEESELDETDHFCLQKLGFDKNVVISSYDENDFISEGNQKMNEFYACAWEKDGLQNEDGTINPSNLEKMVELKARKLFPDDSKRRADVAREGVKTCKDKKGSNNGDTAVKIYNCIFAYVGTLNP